MVSIFSWNRGGWVHEKRRRCSISRSQTVSIAFFDVGLEVAEVVNKSTSTLLMFMTFVRTLTLSSMFSFTQCSVAPRIRRLSGSSTNCQPPARWGRASRMQSFRRYEHERSCSLRNLRGWPSFIINGSRQVNAGHQSGVDTKVSVTCKSLDWSWRWE